MGKKPVSRLRQSIDILLRLPNGPNDSGACKPFYAGHPEVACKKCLGHNGSYPFC